MLQLFDRTLLIAPLDQLVTTMENSIPFLKVEDKQKLLTTSQTACSHVLNSILRHDEHYLPAPSSGFSESGKLVSKLFAKIGTAV